MDPERDAGRRAARAVALARQHQRDEGAVYVDAARYPGRLNAFAAVVVSATTGKLLTASTVRARTAGQAEEAAIALATAKACLVAPRCKIHIDASVALGGGLLAALVPCGLLGASLCVYSLQPRGTLLHTWSFGANAISVSLSPLARYLVVGFATTRGYFSQEKEGSSVCKLT
ncbi:hypothetical protein MRX96_038309 [Rhipicephalus microplus]